MKPFSKLSLLALMGLLGGCIPAPMGKYYKPIYPDPSAQYYGDECYGQAGAPATLSFVIADGVTLHVTTIKTYGERDRKDRPLRLSIDVPAGTQIQFLSREIRIGNSRLDLGRPISPDIHVSAAVEIKSNEIVDYAKIAPTPLAFTGDGASINNFSAATWLNFSWKDQFVPQAFSMEMPPVSFFESSPEDRLPIVLFAKAKKRLDRYPGEYKSQTSLIYTTEQSESASAEKYAKCLADAPENKCRNILIYDEGGFKLEKNGVKYSGRWYVYDVQRNTPFNGEIKFDFVKPLKWRFVSNKVRLFDASAGIQKDYQFDHFPLHFSYQVALDTAIRGVNKPDSGKATTVSINGSLGTEELPRYFVKLPSILINGKVYEIAPIELEKRVFDFGIEPFNC